MSKKKTAYAKMGKHKDLLVLLIPIIIATIVVVYELVPAETLGLFSDAYTVALLFTLLLIAVLAVRKR